MAPGLVFRPRLLSFKSSQFVSKAQQMQSFFSRNKTFLDNFIVYNRSLLFFFSSSLWSSKLLVREKEGGKKGKKKKVS